MAEPVIISWTPANWITIILMVALMYFLLGAGVRIMHQKQQAQKAA